MSAVLFENSEFESLKHIEEFNSQHWKGTLGSMGWKYDVDPKDPKIIGIKESLRRIQKKLDLIRSSFAAESEYNGLESFVQKITLGRTNQYLSHLWLSFINKIENKPPNEPQLQLVATPLGLKASLWFENGHAVKKYFHEIIDSYSRDLKAEGELRLEVYEEGAESKPVGVYTNTEWDAFVGQLRKLNSDCKVGLNYLISKEKAVAAGEKINEVIGAHFDRLKPLFDMSNSHGERFIVAHIEWNDEGWTVPQIPEAPVFRYVKEGHIPHDSLTFKFDKPIDTAERIYGYFQPGRGKPGRFIESKPGGRIIFFMSQKKIVGIYGDAEFLKEPIGFDHAGFEKGRYLADVSGRKDLSLGFLKECYMDLIPAYTNGKSIGQSNFIYIAEKNAQRILADSQANYEKVQGDDATNAKAREHLEKIKGISNLIYTPRSDVETQKVGIQQLILGKKQIILYGPPGTGKTFRTKDIAVRIFRGK